MKGHYHVMTGIPGRRAHTRRYCKTLSEALAAAHEEKARLVSLGLRVEGNIRNARRYHAFYEDTLCETVSVIRRLSDDDAYDGIPFPGHP